MEEHWSSAYLFRNLSRLKKVGLVCVKSEMQILRFYLVGQISRIVCIYGPAGYHFIHIQQTSQEKMYIILYSFKILFSVCFHLSTTQFQLWSKCKIDQTFLRSRPMHSNRTNVTFIPTYKPYKPVLERVGLGLGLMPCGLGLEHESGRVRSTFTGAIGNI